MADPFQPKFVDLVRNYSTTTGTGNFTLGPAVNGYTGFAAALQTGDSFYYGATGVDKPAEREVGRGTLLAGGAISRDPISGTKTNFTSGTKSIALIAPAEWFGKTQATLDSFSPLGKSLASAANAGEARAHLGLAAPVNVKWFGAKGDSNASGTSGADDAAAIQAAVDYIDSLGGGSLFLPSGYYRVGTYIRLCRNIRLYGENRDNTRIVTVAAASGGANAGEDIRNASVLYGGWPSNLVNTVNVSIHDIGLWSTNGAGFYDNCGIFNCLNNCDLYAKYPVIFDQTECSDIFNCNIRPTLGGVGVWLIDGATLTPGNAPGFTNRNGVHFCQLNGDPGTTLVRSEKTYTLVLTSNNYNGGERAIELGYANCFTVINGEYEGQSSAPILVNGAARGSFIGGLISSGASPCVNITANSSLTFDGVQMACSASTYPIAGPGAADSELVLNACASGHASGDFAASPAARNWTINGISEPIKTNSSLAAWNLYSKYAEGIVRCTNVSANVATIRSDASLTQRIGTTYCLEQATAAGTCGFVGEAGVTIVGPTSTSAQYQRITARKIAANSWETDLTDQNSNAPACIASPGSITSSGGKIGYANGAGGTVVQASSKSTAVTLNKLSGQVTMNAAALAASTAVSFTLTNSQVAAGDVLILNHSAGGTAGAYALNAQSAAGSAAVTVRNLTAAALSEPIVIGFAVIKAVSA